MIYRIASSLAVIILLVSCSTASVQADFIATTFFGGTIERFDSETGAQSTFATIASATDQFPGLSGVVQDQANGVIYASARFSHRVYQVDAATGAVLGFNQLADESSPAGLAVDNVGNLYVSNFGTNSISVFDSSSTLTDTINLPTNGNTGNLPSGLAFDAQGRLVISTFAGGGLFRFDPSDGSVSSLAPVLGANGQVAIDGVGDIFVGGAANSSSVLKFASDGTQIGDPFLTIDETFLPQPDLTYESPDFTSPAGVTIDADGNLIVAALGRTNPTGAGDNFQSNGGLWRFSPDGTLLQTFGTNLTPLSSVSTFVVAIPEPGSFALLSLVGLGVMTRRRKRLS